MRNNDYFIQADLIDDPRDRMKYMDHLPMACIVDDKGNRVIHYGSCVPGVIHEILRNTKVGRYVKIYCVSDKAKEEFRHRINSLDNRYYKVIRHSVNPTKSGFYYYNVPGDKNSLIIIEEDNDNELNLIARRISIKELLDNMDPEFIILNQYLGDAPMLSLFLTYLNKFHSLVDAENARNTSRNNEVTEYD